MNAIALARATIAAHSKSFAFASRILPPGRRDEVAVLYAWCRHADDAIDLVPPDEQPAALVRLRQELDAVYAGEPMDDVILTALQQVVRRRAIPREYPDALLDGMEMDVVGARYETWADLLLYCYRVAGTVGLMMSHVLGVRHPAALRHATHLGMAMQLTNICRDVAEDWDRGRLYIPREVLAGAGAPELHDRVGGPLPEQSREALSLATKQLLAEAGRYYRSGDRGLAALSWRTALAVATARRVYADIGARLARRRFDVLAGRVFVPGWRKWLLGAGALAWALVSAPARWLRPFRPAQLRAVVRYPGDVLPV